MQNSILVLKAVNVSLSYCERSELCSELAAPMQTFKTRNRETK
jgi:hypothetical protein